MTASVASMRVNTNRCVARVARCGNSHPSSSQNLVFLCCQEAFIAFLNHQFVVHSWWKRNTSILASGNLDEVADPREQRSQRHILPVTVAGAFQRVEQHLVRRMKCIFPNGRMHEVTSKLTRQLWCNLLTQNTQQRSFGPFCATKKDSPGVQNQKENGFRGSGNDVMKPTHVQPHPTKKNTRWKQSINLIKTTAHAMDIEGQPARARTCDESIAQPSM